MGEGLRIVVLVKQVPNTSEVKIDPKTGSLIREGVESILNPEDRQGLEAAVSLKEKHGGRVLAVTMGPPQAVDVLTEALGMGADASARTSSSVELRIVANWRSEKPNCLALRNRASLTWRTVPCPRSSSSSSTIWRRLSRNASRRRPLGYESCLNGRQGEMTWRRSCTRVQCRRPRDGLTRGVSGRA